MVPSPDILAVCILSTNLFLSDNHPCSSTWLFWFCWDCLFQIIDVQITQNRLALFSFLWKSLEYTQRKRLHNKFPVIHVALTVSTAPYFIRSAGIQKWFLWLPYSWVFSEHLDCLLLFYPNSLSAFQLALHLIHYKEELNSLKWEETEGMSTLKHCAWTQLFHRKSLEGRWWSEGSHSWVVCKTTCLKSGWGTRGKNAITD